MTCRPYWCPTAQDTECCPEHSGWDTCCDRPDGHVPLPRGPLARWRERRNCFHHDPAEGRSWVQGRLIDLGRRKMFDCRRCGRVWIV